MDAAQAQGQETYIPTVADFLRASHENQLAKNVTYTKPIGLGVLGALGMHSFFGITLMSINPLLALASLIPILLGVKTAIASHRQFNAEYSASVENPDDWQEFLAPEKLTMVQGIGLDRPLHEIIQAGMSRGTPELGAPLPGKRQPPTLGASQANYPANSPTANIGLSMAGFTVSTAIAPNSGTAKTGLPLKPPELDESAPHLLLLGGTREGKTEALRYLLAGQPRVTYLTTKVTDHVPAHWGGYCVGGNAKLRQLIWFMDYWAERLDAHLTGKDTEPEWIVADEAIGHRVSLKNAGKSLCDRWDGLMLETCTAGAAVGLYSAILCQTKNSGPIGIDLDILQQNYSVIAAVKRKRSLGFGVFEKMAGVKLTDEQKAEVLQLSGYYQLWMDGNGEPAVGQLAPIATTTRLVETCPAIPDESEDEAAPVTHDLSEVDWAARAPELLTVAPGVGLRKAMAQVFGIEPSKMQGPRWQGYRDGLAEHMRTLDVNLQDKLRQRFNGVDL